MGTTPSLFHVTVGTLSTVLGYVILEMLFRRLSPAIDQWGYLTQPVGTLTTNQRVSGLDKVLQVFEATTPYIDLKNDLAELNAQMLSRERGRSGKVKQLNLYGRLAKGRNLMLHGNLSHSLEGTLLVLLVDFIVLHVAKEDLKNVDT